MSRVLIVCSLLTLLVSAVTACPMINCPMMWMSPSSDDCCSPASDPSNCPQHQSSLGCPENAFISKVSSQVGGAAVVVDPVLEGPGLPVAAVEAVPARVLLLNGGDRYLLLRTLLI